MTPREFETTRRRLRLTAAEFGRLTGYGSTQTIRRWETGKRALPAHAVTMMRLLLIDSRNVVRLRQWARAKSADVRKR